MSHGKWNQPQEELSFYEGKQSLENKLETNLSIQIALIPMKKHNTGLKPV